MASTGQRAELANRPGPEPVIRLMPRGAGKVHVTADAIRFRRQA
jgi:hypothetical protein